VALSASQDSLLLYRAGFTSDITRTSSVPVVMCFYIVLKFVSRRAQDLDFFATRLFAVFTTLPHMQVKCNGASKVVGLVT
jgi:hypothetical protein